MKYDKELVRHKLLRWEAYLNGYLLPQWRDIPDIGLYMDQVMVLLGQYLSFIPPDDQGKDKPLTPTTINNYVRLKVMPAPIKRKYYRVHIAYLIVIFTLKQGASISAVQKVIPSHLSLEEVKVLYDNYATTLNEVNEFFVQQTRAEAKKSIRVIDTQEQWESAMNHLLIKNILMAGFSGILVHKLLQLEDADMDFIIENEKPWDN